MTGWPFNAGQFLIICLGGALGTGARALLAATALRLLGGGFPYGTLAVNALGSLLVSLIMHISLTLGGSATLRMALTTGVMGGFTTYSTFNYETLTYLRAGPIYIGIANVLVTVAVCLLMGMAGQGLARQIIGR